MYDSRKFGENCNYYVAHIHLRYLIIHVHTGRNILSYLKGNIRKDTRIKPSDKHFELHFQIFH